MSNPQLQTKSQVLASATAIRLTDVNDYSTSSIDYFDALVTIPGSNTPITISLYNNPTLLLDYNIYFDITPSALGLSSSTLPDGIYQIEIRIKYTGVSNYYYLDIPVAVIKTANDFIMCIIAKYFESCKCGIRKEERWELLQKIWFQLQAVQRAIDCGNLVDAADILNTIEDFVANDDCDC